MKIDAEWFYETMKEALHITDVGWGSKHLMTIEFDEFENEIIFRGNGVTYAVPIPESN